MRIRVVKSEQKKSWYKDRIGEVFEVIETNQTKRYHVVHRGRLLDSYVEFDDCEIVVSWPKEKPLEYWKKNAEEDYLHTPISVLRYITELENEIKKK